MKGLYMVDADRGFVQYFENLLFTHSKEYKMLGHNFKANEFLTKIKERPDLLNKIDLLFINPKLNDLNGLELFKKVQNSRRDINVCVLVNENIKTFYENDIAELGIENVIIYPNTDEYYLNSVKKIFEKIESKNYTNSSSNTFFEKPKENISDNEIFAELNSDNFLKQFDFDSLSADVFGNKNNLNKTEDIPVPQSNELNFNDVNQLNNNSYLDIQKEDIFNENAQNNKSYNNIYKNNTINLDNYSNNVDFNSQQNVQNSFVESNLGSNAIQNNQRDMFAPNEYSNNEYDIFSSNNEINNMSNDIFNSKENLGYPSNLNGYEDSFNNNQVFEDTYNNYNSNVNNSNDLVYPQDDIKRSNPLDLSAFGVNTNNSNINQNNAPKFNEPSFETPKFNEPSFETPKFNEPSFEDNNLNNGFNNTMYHQENTISQEDILNKPFNYSVNNFDLPYDGYANANQKSNLQNLNRPDIDGIDTFENYGQNNNPSYNNQSQSLGSPNGNLNNNFTGNNASFDNSVRPMNPSPSLERHAGFNKTVINSEDTGFNDFGNNSGLENSGFGHNSPTPSDFGMFNKKPEIKENPYDEYLKSAKAMEQEQMKNASSNLGGFASGQEQINPQRQFGGFDFGKPPVQNNEPVMNNASGFNNLGMGNNPQENNGFNSNSNKSYIENMYNKVGVDDLNYAPTAQNDMTINNVVKHERTSDSTYNQVPDFARQVVAFYSTKGGIGKTSLAVNATIQLAKYSKKKICLIDFDLTNANVHTHLGILDSTYDLSVVSNFESEIDSFSLSRIVTPYRVKDKNGDTVEFDVIVGFKEMKMAQRFSEKEVYKILSILEEMYDIVIVDTHPVYTDLAVSTILKKATKIIFVTEQEMTALNGAKDFILASKKYNIPSEKLFMVLNRYKSQTTIFNKNRIEKGLNKTVLATIPFDMDSLREAVNTNNPVTLANPDSELARAYIDVSKIIDTKLVVPEENKSFFKLFKK